MIYLFKILHFNYLKYYQTTKNAHAVAKHWHPQSSVQFQPAFLHAHLPPHPLMLLQLHFTSSLQAFEATGNMFHTGTQDALSPFSVQPQPSGLGAHCSLCSLVHHIPAWYATRYECCSSASLVGGGFSIVLFFWQNSSFLASFTFCMSLLLSYKIR